jgi:hypothetical protein
VSSADTAPIRPQFSQLVPRLTIDHLVLSGNRTIDFAASIVGLSWATVEPLKEVLIASAANLWRVHQSRRLLRRSLRPSRCELA